MLKAILISSLDKVFLDTKLNTLEPLRSANVYRGSVFSFQIAMTESFCDAPHRRFVGLSVESIEKSAVEFRTVELIPSYMPAYPTRYDTEYVRTTPGLYPDLLQPLQMEGRVPCVMGQTRTVWVDLDVSALEDGKHDIVINVIDGEKILPLTLKLNVIPATLPEIDFPVTQWFHYDCLATYYNVPVFSERHWEIVENFIKTFVKCGNNTLLTPVFTPALDTYVGGERPTVQLVGVARDAEGKYTFDFSLLTRFMDMADRLGIKYFEIAHFFTQWGAAHAPKVMASTPNGYERIFGWDTDATGEEYTTFIRQFITELLDFLKALPACAAAKGITFSTPSEVIDNHKSVGPLEVPYPLSWMDEERDASSWLGNTLQREAFNKLYSVAERIMLTDDKKLKQDFDYLQAAENLRFMTTKQNGIITERCIYESPYDAFTNYMNILGDFLARVRAQYPDMDNEELGSLQQMIDNQEVEIIQLEAEVEQLKAKLATKEKKAAKKAAAPAEAEEPVVEEKPKRKCVRKPKAE